MQMALLRSAVGYSVSWVVDRLSPLFLAQFPSIHVSLPSVATVYQQSGGYLPYPGHDLLGYNAGHPVNQAGP